MFKNPKNLIKFKDMFMEKVNALSSREFLFIIEEIFSYVLPIKINVKSSINEKSIVINQEELNRYINKKISQDSDLKSLDILIHEQYIIVKAKITKIGLNFNISQKIRINKFILNKNEGVLEIYLIDRIIIGTEELLAKILYLMTSFILDSLINKSFKNILEKNVIKINENKFIVDLKTNELNMLYNKNINTILNKNIPIIGEKYIVDFLEVNSIKTSDKEIKIGIKVNLPYISS